MNRLNIEMEESRKKDFDSGLSDTELAKKWGISTMGAKLYRHKKDG